MKKKTAILSIVLFGINIIFCLLTLIGYDEFLLPVAILSFTGFLVALFSKKGRYRNIGLMGNLGIVFMTLILPFIVTVFFWNSP
ncbi:hypothetical protein EQV77_06505 [Halobacillus fulvus]|nr:hypothetical protein EQV77_06505 [Halobacillus fulvus]